MRREELNSEEKFMLGFAQVERFYKKNKFLVLGVIALAIIVAIAIPIKNNIDAENKAASNIAFNKILTNPNDKESLAVLEEKNKRLHQLAIYLQNKKNDKEIKEVNLPYLKELSEYSKAIQNKDNTKLHNLSMENDFLLKEFAIFNKALLLTNEGKYQEARTALNLIPQTSQAYELANLLRHYLLTK